MIGLFKQFANIKHDKDMILFSHLYIYIQGCLLRQLYPARVVWTDS